MSRKMLVIKILILFIRMGEVCPKAMTVLFIGENVDNYGPPLRIYLK